MGAQQHNNPMFSPTSCSSSSPSSLSTPSASQKGHPGLLGVPLNQILSQQKAASFPASSLLSAAAKAQLAYQNKQTANGNGMEGPDDPNPMFPPNSTVLPNTSEAQSGRAALRDKLMAQQRDASRKRKQSSGHQRHHDGGGGNNAALHYSLLNQTGVGGARIPGPGSSSADQLRKVALPAHNTSMAQFLQSMSHQGPHSMAVSGQGPRLDAGPRPPPPGAGPLHHHHHLAPQRAWGPRTTDPGMPLTHPSPQQQSLLLHSGRRTNVAAVAALGVGDGGCGAVDTVGTTGRVFPSGGGGGGPEAVDAIYRAVVDAASRGVHVTIAAMSAFAGEAADLSGLEEAEAPSRGRPAKSGWPQKTPDLGRGTPDTGADLSSDYFHPLSHETPRGQWDGESQHSGGSDGRSGGRAAVWAGEEFLECSTQVRSSPCTERPVGLAPAPPCPAAAAHDYQKGFLDNDAGGGYHTLDHMGPLAPPSTRSGRGSTFEVLGPARQELTGDDQSPGSSTSLEGPLATGRDYYGPYNVSYNNGAAAGPSDTKSLSSEEELRQPDSPSSEPLRYRSGSFRMGELVWGPLRGPAPWPAGLAGGEHLREQAKVEPEKLKTLTHDLEAFEPPRDTGRRAN
ncbi:hypothetical protein CRUP_011867 [Coryphaenoides rupestris]|nr:hypothetical protein CRUP_011867 [Coryphaenoides rupestris]